MFERYTEKARRVVFFARYEASQYGSPVIDSEHLLLGLLRESNTLGKWIPNATFDMIREWVDARTTRRPSIPTSVDLPLSHTSKVILKSAADEAGRLAHRHIGTEHLFVGLLSVPDCLAEQLLRRAGADVAAVRAELAKQPQEVISLLQQSVASRPHRAIPTDTVEIHGTKRNADYVRDVVSTVRSYNFHWHKTIWKPRDIVIRRKDGTFSFELSLAEDSGNFTLVKQGWKKDHCFVCRWELFEAEDEHGTGYTNGRTWLCMECYERFVQRPDFFSSSQSEMT
ncbi:MAG TPA: Clp protease N-terminal domain-containing protein [Candidatus Dormibacteraeota bacterium]|nr:Clp protease N-terminal domain-containing protein [Candidatus Dormibacteraeota bacterium]